MAYRLFEGKEHASAYKKYRISPTKEVLNLILTYLEKRKEKPFLLAVDVGCGSGQGTIGLAPHFQKVVGIDVSEAQLEEARREPGFTNVSYRTGAAELLPYEDGSVDLVTSMSATHWFDTEKFLNEAVRILKPRGCLALLNYTQSMEIHHGACSEQLTEICKQMFDGFLPYRSPKLGAGSIHLYKDLFEAIPFPDKEWRDNIRVTFPMSVSSFIGFAESFSGFQTFLSKDPEGARALSRGTQQSLLETMGVTSPETVVDVLVTYYCLLACKPEGDDLRC
ncbi:putative methyltransferase [Acipenser oxyrinchus oxyrinchus]|uniref:Methyltransferase n=1 Tax=Acipenser oxyrinchus oxyrinchus TaxID=40147 RepID=A0AAD8G2Z8_ACIOX|nr:putative methyltransferase [Acipenser oxyrinchus oxyrinchus]